MHSSVRTAKGMTVLELLVVIAIMGILMGIAIPSVIKSFKTMGRAKKMTATYPEARRALGAMSDMLRQAYEIPNASSTFTGQSDSYEAGGVKFPLDEVSFPVFDTRYAAIGSVQTITYSLQVASSPQDSLRGLIQTRSALGAPPEMGIRETLFPDAVALQFRYLDPAQNPPEWVSEWPFPAAPGIPSAVTAEEPAKAYSAASLPAAVEITVFALREGSAQPIPFRAVVNLPSAQG